ncbi:MAG: hypothetical protein CSA21_03995 [Deltaproteobacteria bacterium]|nr:MAG: hypothetical protein CSA21_03995 [Deltaproteobacteria bacterium]
MRPCIGSVLLGLFILVIAVPALAHRVNVFAYVDGDTVYTESYFSDGTPVQAGDILVEDTDGTTLVKGRTDKQGLLNFPLPGKQQNLAITVSAGMGHRGTFLLETQKK